MEDKEKEIKQLKTSSQLATISMICCLMPIIVDLYNKNYSNSTVWYCLICLNFITLDQNNKRLKKLTQKKDDK